MGSTCGVRAGTYGRARVRSTLTRKMVRILSSDRVQDWLSGKLIAYPLKGRIKIKAAGLINCPTMDRRHKHSTCEIK